MEANRAVIQTQCHFLGFRTKILLPWSERWGAGLSDLASRETRLPPPTVRESGKIITPDLHGFQAKADERNSTETEAARRTA